MSRICFDCKKGIFEFIEVDDVSITVECPKCGAFYKVEPDGLGEGGLEWIDAIEKLKQYPYTKKPLNDKKER